MANTRSWDGGLTGIFADYPCLPCEDCKSLQDEIEQAAKRREARFVLEIGGRAVLALAGGSIEQAKKLCSQAWFREELGCYRSRGNPIRDGEAKLSLRRASLRETAELAVVLRRERARSEFEGYVFPFLVPVDSARQ